MSGLLRTDLLLGYSTGYHEVKHIYIYTWSGVIAFLVGLVDWREEVVLDNLVVSHILARSREFDTIILGRIIISFVLSSVAESVSQAIFR